MRAQLDTIDFRKKPYRPRYDEVGLLGSHPFVRTEWSQQSPPSNIGYLDPADPYYNQGIPSQGPALGWRHDLTRDYLTDTHIKELGEQKQIEWRSQTSPSYFADALLKQNLNTRAPPGTAYTLPTHHRHSLMHELEVLKWAINTVSHVTRKEGFPK